MINKEILEFMENSFVRLKEYKYKGRYFHILTYEDNSPVVVHKKTNQFTYVISGAGTVCLNGVDRDIKEKDGIFIEAGVTHSFKSKTAELTLFHIHIPDEGRDADRYVVSGEDYDRFEIR